MFRKQFKVKSNSRLKTTDKKKLKSDLIKQYPQLEAYPDLEIFNIKSNISVIDLITHSGDPAFIYTTTKYPSFIFCRGSYYPTVFFLWECPQLIFSFTTHSAVYEKLHGGADLMLPGVILSDTADLAAVRKGDCVGVNLTSNSSVVAVGKATISGQDIILGDRKGKCVKTLHCWGDHLCDLAPDISMPVAVPKPVSPPESQTPSQLEENTDSIPSPQQPLISYAQITNTTGGGPPSSDESLIKIVDETQQLTIGSIPPIQQSESMEDLLQFCFYKALLTSAKNAELPLLTNIFYKNHMMEVYPVGSNLDIKKSKYKKLSTFLESMSKEGVIETENTAAGIHKIVKINHSHPLVVQFNKANRDTFVQPPGTDIKKADKGPAICESYRINSAVLRLFSLYDYKKGDILSVADVRRVITSYVKAKQLQDESDKRFLRVDQLLCEMLNKPLNCSLTWEDVMVLIIGLMAQSYQVSLGQSKVISGKGKLPPIEISTANRAGNKKVTLINNLTLYGVNLQEFSKECQHGVAASTTINNVPNLKAEQVQVQGSHINFVGKLLTEKYKIPKRYLRGWNPK